MQITPHQGGWRLVTETHLPRPRTEVFQFFADAANLERLTPPTLRFRILTPLPIEMKAGALIDYRLRVRGVPLRWRSEISRWEPPLLFVDEQQRGPYRWWRHEHRFRDLGDHTVMEDRVDYGVPGGRLVNDLFVAREVRHIFCFRERVLTDLFGRSGH